MSAWALGLWLASQGGTGLAATAYKCTGPDGRATFSDQPCPEGERGDEVELRSQPLIGSPVPPKEGGGEGGRNGEQAAGEGEGADAEEVIEDVRAPRLRRLDFLYNTLLESLNAAGESCTLATVQIENWIDRHGDEARELFAAWDEIRFEKLNLKQTELQEMRARLSAQLKQLRSVTLPRLNAKCWNDRRLGAAFDRLQPYLPGG